MIRYFLLCAALVIIIGLVVGVPVNVSTGACFISFDPILGDASIPSSQCNSGRTETEKCSFTIKKPNYFAKLTIINFSEPQDISEKSLKQQVVEYLEEIGMGSDTITADFIELEKERSNGCCGFGRSNSDAREKMYVLHYWKNRYLKCLIVSNFPEPLMNSLEKSIKLDCIKHENGD